MGELKNRQMELDGLIQKMQSNHLRNMAVDRKRGLLV